MNQQSSNTNVLLLIIPNPSSTILPHSLFYRLFSAYGEVVKILIFEKARVWKAFVEMGNEAQAKLAQHHLNQVEVAEGVLINVYFSTLTTVTFLNNNCGGVDYRQLKLKNAEKRKLMQSQDIQNWYSSQDLAAKKPETAGQTIATNPMFLSCHDIYSQARHSNWFNSTKSSTSINQQNPVATKPTRQSSIENAIDGASTKNQSQEITEKIGNVLGSTTGISNKHISSLKFIKESSQSNDEDLWNSAHYDSKPIDVPETIAHETHEGMSPDDHDIMKAFASPYTLSHVYPTNVKPQVNIDQEITAQLDALDISEFEHLFHAPPNLKQQTVSESDIVDPAAYVNPQFLIENQPSRVIYIRGLQHPSLSPVNIFNLLSNCGNVMVIIYIKQKSSALVQFEKLHQAQNAKDHLNNMPFFFQKLKIFYSNYQQIQFPLPYQSPQTMIYIPSKDQFRFGDGKSISFNPPSQTLHLSNIKQEVTENEDLIRSLFVGIGTIQAIKFMHLNQYPIILINRSKHMALVRLSSLEEAMNGAALLHGKDLFGRKLNVSFTKSKF